MLPVIDTKVGKESEESRCIQRCRTFFFITVEFIMFAILMSSSTKLLLIHAAECLKNFLYCNSGSQKQ